MAVLKLRRLLVMLCICLCGLVLWFVISRTVGVQPSGEPSTHRLSSLSPTSIPNLSVPAEALSMTIRKTLTVAIIAILILCLLMPCGVLVSKRKLQYPVDLSVTHSELYTFIEGQLYTRGQELDLPFASTSFYSLVFQEQSKLPFPLTYTLSKCTYKGARYTDEENDVSLEIPEGAIPEGESLTVDLGVALFGLFQFPEGLRPVSPVFWVCVRDNPDFQFSKPVTISLPHFLTLENDDDIHSLGLTFLKADHNKNSEGLYEFQPTNGEMNFVPSQTYGILKTTHFCCLCLAAKNTLKCLQHTRFCITTVFPESSAKAGQSVDGYLFITFLNLKTCLKKVNDVIEKMNLDGYKRKKESFRFSSKDEDPAIEMVITQPQHGKIGVTGKKMIFRSEVDFFLKERISEGELEELESEEFYPPRFQVFFASPSQTQNTTFTDGKIAFNGATSPLEFDIHLAFAAAEPATNPLALSDVRIQIESHRLVIEDLQEVRSQLLEVAVKWRDIGLELGLSDPQLERIRANNRDDVTDCLTAMLRDWLNRSYNTTRHGEPSWERLSEAVRHRAGGNNPALADLLIQNEFQRHI